jgi:hypothetical protein
MSVRVRPPAPQLFKSFGKLSFTVNRVQYGVQRPHSQRGFQVHPSLDPCSLCWRDRNAESWSRGKISNILTFSGKRRRDALFTQPRYAPVQSFCIPNEKREKSGKCLSASLLASSRNVQFVGFADVWASGLLSHETTRIHANFLACSKHPEWFIKGK